MRRAGLSLAFLLLAGHAHAETPGARLSRGCAACHGPAGTAIAPIAGWPEASLRAALEAYRTGTRESPVMHAIATGLTPAEEEAVAAHLRGLAPRR